VGDSQSFVGAIDHGKGRGFSKAAAVGLRDDFTCNDLRRLSRGGRDGRQVRRPLAVIGDGGSRTEAARLGGVGLQIVRDWVVRFNAEGSEVLIDRKAPGKRSVLTPTQRAALAAAVEAGPGPRRDRILRWRLIDLVRWLWGRFGVSVSQTTVGYELRAMDFRKLSAGRGLTSRTQKRSIVQTVWPAVSAN
jgi:transposase